MILLTLSLERSSLRFVEFAQTEERLVMCREEKYSFSSEATDQKIFLQEIQAFLSKIKKTWELPHTSIHCIFSSDFLLLRTLDVKKYFCLLPTAALVWRDARKFIPSSAEQMSIAYLAIQAPKAHAIKTVTYAAIKTNFLEAVCCATQEAGFDVGKVSLLPLSLHSLRVEKSTLLIDFSKRALNALIFSPHKNLEGIYCRPLGNTSKSFCEQETGLPWLLFIFLKRELKALIDSKEILAPCWIVKPHFSNQNIESLSLFLEKEFRMPTREVDPCLYLDTTFQDSCIDQFIKKSHIPLSLFQYKKLPPPKLPWKFFLKIKKYQISSISKFTIPSIAQLQRRKKIALLIYALAFCMAFFSLFSLLFDCLENQKLTENVSKNSLCLKQRQAELIELRQCAKNGLDKVKAKKKLYDFQHAHDQWPLLLNELYQYVPQGLWITELMPIVKEAKDNAEPSKIIALKIRGLYLEGINGEQIACEYAQKLATSSLFATSKKEDLCFSCAKEDGTAYAYPFSFQLPLGSFVEL